MRFRLHFSLKIMLPYLLLVVLFTLIFLFELERGDRMVSWISAAGIACSLVVGLIQNSWLGKPLTRVKHLVHQLTLGKIPEFHGSVSADEIGELERSLQKHLDNLREVVRYARSMAGGDFTGRIEKLSQEDEMRDALLSLNKSLKVSLQDSENRRMEEEHRTWSAQGLARFSSLFREAEDNLYDLSGLLMKELVGYTEADVGALFITKEEDGLEILELYGSYAFDREKYMERSYQFGEGLVGRAAVEKEVIYITDMPEDYIKIRSGLGEGIPSSVLLVPVILDDHVHGVIELASLGEIPSYQTDFIRSLADALATTLAKVKANLKTRELFEQTRKQAEELASQEKVFRQNMEALEKSQEAYAQREKELLKEIDSLRKK